MASTALAGAILCATMVRFSPGFGTDDRLLDPRLSEESRQALARSHDEERNPVRFCLAYLKRAMSGDLGTSQSLNRPIGELIADRAPTTTGLMGVGMAGAWILAAVLAAIPLAWRLSGVGAACNILSGVSASLPAAAIAVVLFRLRAPVQAAIAVILFPRLYQYLKNVLAQSYAMPHVLLATAKGLCRRRIFLRHVLWPARGELLALAAVSVNMAFGAAIAAEAICDVPGLGHLAWKAAMARDLPLLVAVTVIITLMTQVSNLAADALSPRRRA